MIRYSDFILSLLVVQQRPKKLSYTFMSHNKDIYMPEAPFFDDAWDADLLAWLDAPPALGVGARRTCRDGQYNARSVGGGT
jgi:hypothetical protein